MPKLSNHTEDKVPETQSNDSCEFDFEDALGDVLNKRYDQERRAAELLSEQFDTSDLPEEEYNTLFTQMFDKVRAEDEAIDLQKKRSLRRIKTLRTQEEIKSAIDAGHKILKQKVIPSKEIRITEFRIRNIFTGKRNIVLYSFDALSLGTKWYEIVRKVTYYPYTFPSNVAAYLLPNDLLVGERVILEDLIEDIVAESHAWGTYRLDSAEAVWNGEKFEIDCNSYKVGITFG